MSFVFGQKSGCCRHWMMHGEGLFAVYLLTNYKDLKWSEKADFRLSHPFENTQTYAQACEMHINEVRYLPVFTV